MTDKFRPDYATNLDGSVFDAKGSILHTHRESDCTGRYCVIHNPSDHIMTNWPTLWRADIGIMERLCEHGVGHPDPDDIAYKESIGVKGYDIHGCDGCCCE